MKNIMKTSIIAVFALMTIVPARADIASKKYVDDRNNTLIFGTTAPDSETLEYFEQNGGVVGGMGEFADRVGAVETDVSSVKRVLPNAVNREQSVDNAIVVTDGDGYVTMATGGVLTDTNINHNANIQLGKLAFPTPGPECSNNGCMLMFYNGKYVWELVARDSGETVSETGAVNATATTNAPVFTDADGLTVTSSTSGWSVCPQGTEYNSYTGQCETWLPH